MDFLPDDQAKVADQLSQLATGPEAGVDGRILEAVSRAHAEPAGRLARLRALSNTPLGPLALAREQRSLVALLLTFTLTVPLVVWNLSHTQNYHTTLTPQVQSLIGGVDEGLAAQISFDQAKNQYVFNASGKTAKTPAPADLHSLQVGADPQNPADTYSVDLPTDPTQGFTYYNNHLQLSFTLIPQFPMGPAQETGGRIVYPMENGGEAIYTVKGNGLREDLIFTQPTTIANFAYQLKLPDTLQAQTKDGVIGLYSADPSLFGNISFGSDADKMKVVDARTKSAKTNLVFAVAPPVVQDIHGNGPTANYSFSGDQLQVSANNLSTLAYPITLDPSIVVNTTAGFTAGNNEGDIDFPANKINRGGLTGGVIGAWAATTVLPTATSNATSVAYNGYVYEIGGFTTAVTGVVDYAPINADGTIGAWTATTSLLVATDFATSVAYNGYLYEIGGDAPAVTAVVDYAPINADGTIGSWTATTSLPVATDLSTSVAYNGYLYEIGGNATVTAVVDYAPIHADGTIGSWTATTSLPIATSNATSVAYNGYLYELGGRTGASTFSFDVYYAPINSNGTIGTWVLTSAFATQAINQATSVAYNGYLYEIGGRVGVTISTVYLADVQYAQVNANGSLGPWTITTILPTTNNSATSVVYNGYVYEIGGKTTTTAVTTVNYAKIQPAGWIGSGNPTAWGATTSLPVATQFSNSVAYNGYVYEIGGSDAVNPTAVVDYAPINADGTIGAWTATTPLPVATGSSSSVAYNGFLYEIGGSGAVNPTAVVDYAPINANGTIGAWTATTSLPAVTYYATSVAYNGFLYEIGGYGALNPTAVVDSAPINANGTIGAWTATTSLPVATYQATSVAYNGFLYEIGGAVPAATAVVDYAPINANGTIGAWTATTPLPVATRLATSVVYNGFLYQIGGYDTAATAVVDYAPINANGTIGAWTATTPLPTATYGATSVAYNGYVYEIGGFTTVVTAVVDYAPINNGGPGTLGSWTATTSLLAPTEFSSSVAYNGYVYEIGGCTGSNCVTPVATVDYVAINANGTLATPWQATTSLLAATTNLTSVAYNGYLYELGGEDVSFAYLATVDYAPINANGTIGSWTATTSLPVATTLATSVAYNGYVYEIGGNSGSWTAVVDYASINADGTLGSWTATTSLPVATDYATSVVYNGYVYEIGGCTGGLCNTSAVVDYAPINTNGTVGSWTPTTSLPVANSAATSVAYNGYVYEIGGSNSAVVDYAPLNANGTIGSWTAATSLPATTWQATSVVYNGYLYEIGGAGPTAVVDYAPLNVIPRTAHYSKLFNEGAAGGLTGWTATTSLPAATDNATSVAYNGYLYEMGGDSPAVTAVVDYAPIGEDGTIGAWNATISLPTATGGATSVAYNGYIYEIGGDTGAVTAVVDYAPVNANGTIGAWTATTSLPAVTKSATSVAYNGYVYEIGGCGVSCAATAVVDYALFCTGSNSGVGGCGATAGTIGTWTATTSLPAANDQATSVAYNGYLYEIGGCATACPTAVVDYVAINADGTLGTPWTATTSLPTVTEDATSVAYNGYLYELGGNIFGSRVVDYAPINAGGTIGSWTGTTSLPLANELATSVVYNGYVYEIGGFKTTQTAVVDYAPITYPIPVGTLVSMAYTGTIPGGTASIAYETAGSNALLSASAASSTIAQGNCISGSIQYIWIRVTLDDSQAGAVFADSIGTNNANATSLTINYMAHPPANQRLHGGKQFSNNVQGPLDTCHQ